MLIGSGRIRSRHSLPDCVAGSLSPDNLQGMGTVVSGEYVEMVIIDKPIRSLTASVDDYLMNLSIADELCCERMNGTKLDDGMDLQNNGN
ncbi:MAG: KEOPS complex subunit Pcc1 [Methanocalculus sp.]|uniref:KEOPS complex subunit Pcc1 n=1 Tax=Methanocalculus sp. TaxID=2004547 RepID=UPI0027213A41|nr:KEOPS complex subunit Pcc1 [Methanocalculus sp.]MDO8841006.1 KEOPS complex subunit Pcc1 [Methanocalculus sp.]MDO9539891.1 KEOPS complex subunit Pcc1 [Methanocalculus sp.]